MPENIYIYIYLKFDIPKLGDSLPSRADTWGCCWAVQFKFLQKTITPRRLNTKMGWRRLSSLPQGPTSTLIHTSLHKVLFNTGKIQRWKCFSKWGGRREKKMTRKKWWERKADEYGCQREMNKNERTVREKVKRSVQAAMDDKGKWKKMRGQSERRLREVYKLLWMTKENEQKWEDSQREGYERFTS